MNALSLETIISIVGGLMVVAGVGGGAWIGVNELRLRAIRRGHLRVHRGLHLSAPVLVLTSDRSVHPAEWEPAVDESDIVLDVNLMARWAFKLGSHVSVVQVPGALHDITLSHQPARDRAFDEISRWLSAYVS